MQQARAFYMNQTKNLNKNHVFFYYSTNLKKGNLNP